LPAREIGAASDAAASAVDDDRRQIDKKGGTVAWHEDNRRSDALLDSAGPDTCRPADTPVATSARSTTAEVHEAGDVLVVRVRLAEGPLELRIPKATVAPLRQPQFVPRRHHIPGLNAEAIPC
jgi:hypothetical protein